VIPPPGAEITPLRRRALVVSAGVIAALAFVASLVQVFDPDMFHHLALGRDILRHGLRAEDPFLFPIRGEGLGPMPYWLGSVALYGWHALFGDGGLAYLPAVVAAITVAILLADAAPREGRHTPLSVAAALVPIALAVASFRYRATARTELFAVPLLAATLWAVRRHEDGRPRALLLFPLAALLWANLHTSVVVGAAVVGLHAAAGVAARALGRVTGCRLATAPARRDIGLSAAVALVAVAASLANPSSINPVLTAVRFVAATVGVGGVGPEGTDAVARALPFIRRLVDEMKPPGLRLWTQPAGLLLALTAASFALRWRVLRWREVATVAAFTLLATRAQRFGVFFAIPCAPIAARNLGAALAAVPERLGRLRARAIAGGALAAMTLAVPLVVRDASVRPGTGFRVGAYPVRAADYLKAIGFEGPLYNWFASGGYLEWREVGPVFQDGRGLLPAGHEEVSLVGPALRERFAALDAVYRFEALVLSQPHPDPADPPITPGSDWAADSRTWALVAFDDGGLLFLRRDGKYAELAARDEYRWARPSYAPYAWQPRELPALLAEYRRSVAESPACVLCRYFNATAAFSSGAHDEALRVSAPVLEGADYDAANVVRVAAKSAELLGRNAQARDLYGRLLWTGLDDRTARRGLARLALKAGDPAGAARALRESLAHDPQRDDVELAIVAARALGQEREVASWQGYLQVLARKDSSAELVRRGLAASSARDPAAAVTWFEAAIQAWEASPAAHSNLGYALLDLGRVEDAIRAQRRAVELDPRFGAAHYGLGMALERRGDRAGAAAAFRAYLEVEPSGYWSVKAAERIGSLERR
jgi:tetratricopeptide (TPR) repeat protein